MKIIFIGFILQFIFSINYFNVIAQTKQAVDYVNPMIGTAFEGFADGLEGGGTMPCVNEPFAMTNFVAQTNQNKIGVMSYNYENEQIIGFLATHQPMLWMGDYGYVSIMPQVGKLKTLPEDRALSFSHENEVSKPYYYGVKMKVAEETCITGEIAAVNRTAIYRFKFPEDSTQRFILQGINLDLPLHDHINDYISRIKCIKGYVKVDTMNNRIIGYNPDRQSLQLGPELQNFKGYFIVQFDKPIKKFGTWHKGAVQHDELEIEGEMIGVYVELGSKEHDDVLIKVSTSFISLEQAEYNLKMEIPNWDFDEIVKQTRNKWQSCLCNINIEADYDSKVVFYTALYHTMLFPREISEYGKYYSPFDDRVHEGISYTDFSTWDTFRALHPLFTILQSERVNEMIRSLLQSYQQGGWLPKWPNPTYTNIMIGTHADAIITDAFIKGYRDYDINLALEAVLKNATTPPGQDKLRRWADREPWTTGYEARGGLTYYLENGYVPADRTSESVSRTIEFGIDDWCIAQMSKEMGRDSIFYELLKRSKYYKNLYNEKTGFFAPKNNDGSWSVNENEGFTEGTKWTYLFGALHDIDELIKIFGGKGEFIKKLDENFANEHYRHDNEPGHHYIYLYNYAGQPWKTQELVREHTSERNYRNHPIGINGNDDCGQSSAWYLFSSLGFYPVTPTSDYYILGAPQFSYCEIILPTGKSFRIKANGISKENKYVKEVTLNGHRLNTFMISHKDIMDGGMLEFDMVNSSIDTYN